MTRIFCLLSLIFFISHSTSYAGERPKEFLGLLWGTHISKIEGLVPKKERLPTYLPGDFLEKTKETLRKSEERGEKTYLRPSDILAVPGGEVKAIEYVFVKDLLAQGTIYFDNFDLYLNYLKIYTRLYGEPDKEELDEMTMKYDWYTKNDDEADVAIFYGPLIKAGFVSMKCKAFLGKGTGLISGDDTKMESREADWQLFREDDDGKWFYRKDGLTQAAKDIFKVRVKCNLSAKRKNEWRISLKSKIMPRVSISLEEIRCSSKESRNLQVDILSERGPLGSFQKGRNWEPIAPDSVTGALYNKVCK